MSNALKNDPTDDDLVIFLDAGDCYVQEGACTDIAERAAQIEVDYQRYLANTF